MGANFFDNTNIPETIIAKGTSAKEVLRNVVATEQKKSESNNTIQINPALTNKRTSFFEEEEDDNTLLQEKQKEEATKEIKENEKITASSNVVTIFPKEIRFSGELDLNGTDCEINGMADGKIRGRNIYLKKGEKPRHLNIESDLIEIDKDSILIGNINTSTCICKGAIKGNIYAANALELKAGAVIVGNVEKRRINIDETAVIKGEIKLIGNEIDENKLTNLFNEE